MSTKEERLRFLQVQYGAAYATSGLEEKLSNLLHAAYTLGERAGKAYKEGGPEDIEENQLRIATGGYWLRINGVNHHLSDEKFALLVRLFSGAGAQLNERVPQAPCESCGVSLPLGPTMDHTAWCSTRRVIAGVFAVTCPTCRTFAGHREGCPNLSAAQQELERQQAQAGPPRGAYSSSGSIADFERLKRDRQAAWDRSDGFAQPRSAYEDTRPDIYFGRAGQGGDAPLESGD
jgi:hypothetical protein